MLKMIGAVMIFGSCASMGLAARQNLHRRVRAADAMLLALSLIASEINCRRAPLPEIVSELSESDNAVIHSVFCGLQRRMREQTDVSFGYLWRMNLRDKREEIGLGKSECDILCEAASYLGRYDAAEQAAGLALVSRRLSTARNQADDELRHKGGLYRTCGIAMGLLVILVLI
ncbi:MAG: stage III sporulation protein AB [Agathobaculum sp.]|jgi:stage III sporulation protein AB|uniref:stage III sporulation protein AB n=1 Tax=Agathobaculum sp. TaxID=2048138 RepID=UPI003D93CAB5